MKLYLPLMFFISTSVNAIWYESKVVEVSVSVHGDLYIRTELNPNPNGCPGKWAGANWDSTSNSESKNLAASIAL